MPLNAIGWTSDEDEKLVELVQPNTFLYNVFDPSRKNILARESTWQEIAQALSKPDTKTFSLHKPENGGRGKLWSLTATDLIQMNNLVEECKKRWRGLRDGYMRSKRVGAIHKTKVSVFEKLQFLDDTTLVDSIEDSLEVIMDEPDNMGDQDDSMTEGEQQVITDNQEYYEVTVVDGPQDQQMTSKILPFIKILPKPSPNNNMTTEPTKVIGKVIGKKNAGRKKSIPIPTNMQPIKILPKPIIMNGPKVIRYVEDQKTQEQRSETIDKLIEKILKENTNEIDVFFRSMAASVKKLQPHMIPKVKMEVCNVIAKYEMQSFDKSQQNF